MTDRDIVAYVSFWIVVVLRPFAVCTDVRNDVRESDLFLYEIHADHICRIH